MKINRKDQLAIASLIYENFEDQDFQSDGMDDGMGMDAVNDDDVFGDDQSEPDVSIMQIDPVAPVESFESEENKQVLGDLKKLTEYTSRLQDICNNCDIEPWMVAKISKAAEYVSDIYYMLDDTADFANMGADQASPQQDL